MSADRQTKLYYAGRNVRLSNSMGMASAYITPFAGAATVFKSKSSANAAANRWPEHNFVVEAH